MARSTAGKVRERRADLRQALFVRLMVVNSGAAAAEYTFLIAFISILAAIGMVLLGDDLQAYFLGLQQALANAGTPTADTFS